MRALTLAVIFLFSSTTGLIGQQHDNGSHTIVAAPEAIEWAPAPPSLPEGAELAVIEGNPAEAGEFTMRLRMPPNYRIPPHYHEVTEHITVIQGTFNVGMGDEFNPSEGSGISEGTFAAIPPGTRHFAWTEEEVIIQLHGNGPWGIFYVNPEDDPRENR